MSLIDPTSSIFRNAVIRNLDLYETKYKICCICGKKKLRRCFTVSSTTYDEVKHSCRKCNGKY